MGLVGKAKKLCDEQGVRSFCYVASQKIKNAYRLSSARGRTRNGASQSGKELVSEMPAVEAETVLIQVAL